MGKPVDGENLAASNATIPLKKKFLGGSYVMSAFYILALPKLVQPPPMRVLIKLFFTGFGAP